MKWDMPFTGGPWGLHLKMITERDLGIGVTIDVDNVSAAKKYTVAALLAVAIWNSIEMLPIIYFTFTRLSGLYFWSMIASNMGVLVYAVGFILNNFQVTGNQTLPTILTCAAWIPMVSAQSLVLYSRLHLIDLSHSTRRWVLIMIIFNGITMHTATAATTIGANSKRADLFYVPYGVVERMQVTVFFIQELILSSLYLWKAKSFLGLYRERKARGGLVQQKMRSMVIHLILSNVAVVVLDIMILVLEFLGLYFVQVSYKAFVYSVKLKCEIGILNRLVDFVKCTTSQHQLPSNEMSFTLQRQQDWNDFQLNSQMEREWETTLRNTFGVPVGVETQMKDADDETALETRGPGTGIGIATEPTTAAPMGGSNYRSDKSTSSSIHRVASRSSGRSRLSWPLRTETTPDLGDEKHSDRFSIASLGSGGNSRRSSVRSVYNSTSHSNNASWRSSIRSLNNSRMEKPNDDFGVVDKSLYNGNGGETTASPVNAPPSSGSGVPALVVRDSRNDSGSKISSPSALKPRPSYSQGASRGRP